MFVIGQYYPVDNLEGVKILHHGSDYSIGNVFFFKSLKNNFWITYVSFVQLKAKFEITSSFNK